MLQNILNYPALAVEFSSRIEEEFVGSEVEAAREILEVWRTVTGEEEPLLQSQLILERLQSSRHYAHYCDLVAREMVLQTPENAARVEVELTFEVRAKGPTHRAFPGGGRSLPPRLVVV